MAAAAKTMSGMFKDPASYKAAEFRSAADTIRERSGVNSLRTLRVRGRQPAVEGQAEHSRGARPVRPHRERPARLRRRAGRRRAENPGPMPASMRMKPGEAIGGGPLGTHVRNEHELAAMPAEHAFHLMLQTCTTCHARFRME